MLFPSMKADRLWIPPNISEEQQNNWKTGIFDWQ